MPPSYLRPSLVLPIDGSWPLDRNAKKVEIDEFIADEPMTNLFLLGLREMMTAPLQASDDPNEDWFSFYNLASIHGYPNELWRGVPNTKGDDPLNGFYCAHGSTVFPTWHRLYLHMYEQAVYRAMEKVASRFITKELREAHKRALKRFRLPYWDPCLPRRDVTKDEPIQNMWDVPLLLKQDEVWVVNPEGKDEKIPNPLLSFTYPSDDHYKESRRTLIDWSDERASADNISKILETGRVKTLRSPTATGESSHDRFQQMLRVQYSSLSVNLVQMLHADSVAEKPWDTFANNLVTGKVRFYEDASEEEKNLAGLLMSAISLESWHDNVHGLVGSGDSTGHMGSLSVAAFDPLFWLHHNNTDRIFALYQAMYEHLPNKFVADDSSDPDAFVATSPLSPFVKYQKGRTLRYYDSNDVKDWTGLGFAVPGDRHFTTQKGRDAVATYIREVYSWSTEVTVRPKETLGYPRATDHFYSLTGTDFDLIAEKEVEFLAIEHDKIVVKTYATNGELKDTKDYNVEHTMDQLPKEIFTSKAETYTWSVLMNVDKYAFKGTFYVQIFIGKGYVPPASKGADYQLNPHLAGASTVFAFTPEGDCANCRSHADATYGDVISLTAKLREFLNSNNKPETDWPPKELRILDSLEPDDVLPFLTHHLEWRIVDTDGVVATKEECTAAGLMLLVVDSVYTYPTPENKLGPLGSYSDWHLHREVTKGRIGGV